MAIRVVRLGTPRAAKEGLRVGTVRRPPRGVRKEDYAGRDYFDLWLPELAPSAPLVKWALSEPFTSQRWTTYARRYTAEMQSLRLSVSSHYWRRSRLTRIFQLVAIVKMSLAATVLS